MGIRATLLFETAADVQLRLDKSVVLYQGRPVFVGQNLNTQAGGANDLTLDVWDMVEEKWLSKIHSSDEELDIRSQRLGYMNYRDQAVYIARMPCRKQRQGLTRENTFAYYPDHQQRQPDRRDGVVSVSSDQLRSKPFGQMILGEYPTFDEALKKVSSGEAKAVAFARKLMIMRDEIGLLKLHRSTTPIAFYSKSRGVFSLTEELEHYMRVMKAHDIPVVVND